MNIRVDLLPKGDYHDVVIVIDVLRTCTIAPILFDRGLQTLFVSASIKRALRLAQTQELLLIGERRGLPPEGFNYGNSPAELANAPLEGQRAVLVSENAPRILAQTLGAKHLLLGSLYNAGAVADYAASLASEEVAIVCSGFAGNEDLDDALCAGYLAALLKRRFGKPRLSGAALMSISLLKAFPRPVEALWQSRAGHYLRGLDLKDDIAISSLLSQTRSVARLREVSGDEGTLLHRFEGEQVPVRRADVTHALPSTLPLDTLPANPASQ